MAVGPAVLCVRARCDQSSALELIACGGRSWLPRPRDTAPDTPGAGQPKVFKVSSKAFAAARSGRIVSHPAKPCASFATDSYPERPMSAFACPSCERHLKVKAGLAGKRVRCPFCKHTLLVPSASPVSATLAEAATLLPEGTPAPQPSLEDPARAVPAEKDEKPEDELLRQLSPPEGQGETGRLGPSGVVKVLGAGGRGVVLRGEAPLLKRGVALKVMLPALAASDGNRQRFLQEGQAAAAISHDHVVPI